MRGQRVPEHFQLYLETREAESLERVLADLLDPENRSYFGLNELEEETVQALVRTLQEE